MGNETIRTLITFCFSATFVGFIQFLIQRHDNKNNKFNELDAKIDEGLQERENTGKERYDEHKQAIKDLREIMSQLARNIEEQQKIVTANSELLRGIAQDKLFYLTDKYIERGVITLDELAVLEDIYTPYSSDTIKGNGRGKTGIEKCRQLPLVSEEIAKLKDEEILRQDLKINKSINNKRKVEQNN